MEPKQETHIGIYVECIVWRAIEDMCHKKYMKFYRMSSEAFDNLVQMLTSYLKVEMHQSSSALAKDQENCCTREVYRFAHGISPNHIANCFKVGGVPLQGNT